MKAAYLDYEKKTTSGQKLPSSIQYFLMKTSSAAGICTSTLQLNNKKMWFLKHARTDNLCLVLLHLQLHKLCVFFLSFSPSHQQPNHFDVHIYNVPWAEPKVTSSDSYSHLTTTNWIGRREDETEKKRFRKGWGEIRLLVLIFNDFLLLLLMLYKMSVCVFIATIRS